MDVRPGTMWPKLRTHASLVAYIPTTCTISARIALSSVHTSARASSTMLSSCRTELALPFRPSFPSPSILAAALAEPWFPLATDSPPKPEFPTGPDPLVAALNDHDLPSAEMYVSRGLSLALSLLERRCPRVMLWCGFSLFSFGFDGVGMGACVRARGGSEQQHGSWVARSCHVITWKEEGKDRKNKWLMAKFVGSILAAWAKIKYKEGA